MPLKDDVVWEFRRVAPLVFNLSRVNVFFGAGSPYDDYQNKGVAKPYEGPVGTRTWQARAGKFEITGWTGELRDVAGKSFDRFILPAGEQVPCLNANDYQCEHWITQGWWDDNLRLVLCVTCADHRSDSCGF